VLLTVSRNSPLLILMCLQHSILADLPTMWGDAVFYYQTMQYSQSAGVLHNTWSIGSLHFPNPYLQMLIVTVKNAPKLYTPNILNITP
jgi:hypothetical protein